MTDDKRQRAPWEREEAEERAQKGVDVRPVVNVSPSDMPRPSGFAPQPKPQTSPPQKD